MHPTETEEQARRAMRDAGFTDPQANFACTMLTHARRADPVGDIDGAGIWLATFLPPEWICRLLANHVTSAERGIDIYERAQRSPNLTLRLDLRADALGANCRDLIVDPTALRRRIDHLEAEPE